MFGDIGKMMKLASEMKTKLPEMKAKLGQSVYIGEAEGGAVRATVNGKLKLTDLVISPDAMFKGPEGVAELVIATVEAAQDQAAKAAEEAMKELTGGMDLGGLGDMLG
ncbi:MAG: YbaB/EbfC family nucleoid-associated protein [Phycisphaerales bacterium]|jgi:nucleoid-associated protein EbfC|nr:YbaB/EbfC family nucleoid-associated protein [Phycisphaerales bacterium]MBT7171381.1 YbaB/EbfC family nucleoid-associated protein [Phycisphaerales bacterium]